MCCFSLYQHHFLSPKEALEGGGALCLVRNLLCVLAMIQVWASRCLWAANSCQKKEGLQMSISHYPLEVLSRTGQNVVMLTWRRVSMARWTYILANSPGHWRANPYAFQHVTTRDISLFMHFVVFCSDFAFNLPLSTRTPYLHARKALRHTVKHGLLAFPRLFRCKRGQNSL